jgi:O-antigen/teichoic acid export membrane protein
LAVQFGGAAVAAGSAVLAARMLGPAGRGVVAVSVSVGFLSAALGTLGLNEATPYLINQRGVSRSWLLRLFARIGLPAGVLAGLGCSVVVWFITGADTPVPMSLLIAQGAWVVLRVWNLLAKGIVVAAGTLETANAADLLEITIPAACVVMAYASGGASPALIVAFFLAGTSVSAVLLTIVAIRMADDAGSACTLCFALQNSWKLQLRMAGYVMAQRLDVFLMNAVGGAGLTGLYAAAKAVPDMLAKFGDAAAYVTLPSASRGSESDARDSMRVTLALATTLTLGATVLFSVLAPTIINILFGQAFGDAVWMMRYLLAATSAGVITAILSAYHVGRGRAGVAATATWVGVAVLAASAPLLSFMHVSVAVPAAVTISQLAAAMVLIHHTFFAA